VIGQKYGFIFKHTDIVMNTFALNIQSIKIMVRISNKMIVIVGSIMLLVLGLFHLTFWDTFDWANELPKLSKGRELVPMMNICVICYLLSMSIILFVCRSEITKSKVGRLLLLSLALFFLVRLILEFVFPGGSWGLSCILLFLVILYIIPVLRRDAE